MIANKYIIAMAKVTFPTCIIPLNDCLYLGVFKTIYTTMHTISPYLNIYHLNIYRQVLSDALVITFSHFLIQGKFG